MTNNFFYPDLISVIRRDGTRTDNIRAQVGSRITTEGAPTVIEDGDEIQRRRPDGGIDRYLVIDNGYIAGPKTGFIQAHYSIKYRKINDLPQKEMGTTIIYNLHGANSRVNNHSHDESINVVNTTAPALFEDLRKALREGVADKEDLAALTERVDAMEVERDQPSFVERYKDFILYVGAYMSIAAPFIPALSQLLHQ